MDNTNNSNSRSSSNGGNKKPSGFGILVNSIGMILLVIMLTFVSVNFMRDARILKTPLIASESASTKSVSKKSTETSDSYGTIQYEKSDASDSGSSSSKSTKKSGTVRHRKVVTPTPLP